jgi:hypothetical protein
MNLVWYRKLPWDCQKYKQQIFARREELNRKYLRNDGRNGKKGRRRGTFQKVPNSKALQFECHTHTLQKVADAHLQNFTALINQ